MPQHVLQVKNAYPAREGKKFGSVIDADGSRYACPADLVAEFKPGNQVRVEWAERKWGGEAVRVIEKVVFEYPSNGANNITTGTAKLAGNGCKDEQLFVLALAKSAIESNRITDMNEDALVETIQMFRAVYRRTFGASS
jgi:hypothetical protein